MQTPNKVKFTNSISAKVIIALIIIFALVIAAILYVVEKEGYEKIRAETDKLIIKNGEQAVDVISFDINSVMRSATQLRDGSQIAPLQKPAFEQNLDHVFNKNNLPLLGSGGIWPDAYALDPTKKALPLVRLRQDDEYLSEAANSQVNNYLEETWFAVVKLLDPKNCLWNHVSPTQTGNQLAISCGLSIERQANFWGVASVNFTLDSMQSNIETINKQLGQGYALLIDNGNQIVASSDPTLVPYINSETGKPLLLNDLITNNPALYPVIKAIEQHRKSIIEGVRANAPETLVDLFNKFDQKTGTETGSMLINYKAFSDNLNPNVGSLDTNFLGSYNLTNDAIYGTDAKAYMFVVPETLWKLVIVKPASEVNAIAEDLTQNLLKYLLFALLATAGVLFLLLDFVVLNPLQRTSTKISQAESIINSQMYNKLSEVKFSHLGKDEIGLVNRSLRNLLTRIKSNEGKLATVNQQLEQKVEERTAELKDTLDELKSSQVQLIRSEKMATLGQMVAGVAHEVNTPLSYVQNNIEVIGQISEQYEELIDKVDELKVLMLDDNASESAIEPVLGDVIELSDEIREDELPEELRELVKDSLFGVTQISEMVLNLRNFARLDESKIKQIDIRECIKSSLKITQNTLKTIQVKTYFDEVPEVTCSPSQINQVLVNLLNNAAQAIGDKPDGMIGIRTSADDDNLYIDIKDNGSGMSRQVAEKIFEPFFTTKAASEGTGLGMAISHQIMEQHNGEIKLKTTLGEGTVFRLVLPLKSQLSEGS